MVIVNGEEKNIAGQNLLDFLNTEGYEPTRIVVEINLDIVPRDNFSNVTIQDQDTIEVLRFVGGG